jgi:hypothetical protein
MQQPDNWSIINAIASAVSSLAALTAVIVAVKAFNQAREDRKTDAKSHRPKFHPFIFKITREADKVWSLESYFQNQGINSATAVSLEVCIYDSQFRKREFRFKSEPSHDIHQNYGISLEQRRFAFAHPNEEYYFVYQITYQDSNTGDNYKESFYVSGKPPTEEQIFDTHLELVSRDIQYRIDQGIKQFPPVDNPPRQIQ